jgi:adenylylsulfate kinase
MQDSHFRSIIKAVSWRIFGTLMTMAFTFLVTQKITFALYIGLFEFVAKIILFYLHERLWNVVSFDKVFVRTKQQA